MSAAGLCDATRLNYAALNDELMKGSTPSLAKASNASSIEEYADAAKGIAEDLTNCGFSCVIKFFIDAVFSTATLLVVSVLPGPNPTPALTLTLTLTPTPTPTLTLTLTLTPPLTLTPTSTPTLALDGVLTQP